MLQSGSERTLLHSNGRGEKEGVYTCEYFVHLEVETVFVSSFSFFLNKVERKILSRELRQEWKGRDVGSLRKQCMLGKGHLRK